MSELRMYPLPPKYGLNRAEAAAVIGVGPTKFDELVATGAMPAPHIVGSRRLWGHSELIAAFLALPTTEKRATNSWDGEA